MSATTRRYGLLGAALAALLLLIVILVTPPGFIPGTAPALAADTCPQFNGGMHLFANDAPKGSHQFGPEIPVHTVDAGTAAFSMANQCDPAVSAASIDFVRYGANVSAEQVEADANSFVSNRDAWQKSVDDMNNEIVSWSVADSAATYETLGMIPNGANIPTVIKVDRPVAAGWLLVAHLKDGTTREFRFICFLQPVSPHFPHVPTTPPAPPVHKKQPTPQPTTKCVAKKKPASNAVYNAATCMWVVPKAPHKPVPSSAKPSKCVCVTKAQVNQPVQDNSIPISRGVNLGTTPNRGTPATHPAGPTPVVNSPAPLPVGNGYNAGGAGPSYDPGGSVTGADGSTTTGNTQPDQPPTSNSTVGSGQQHDGASNVPPPS